MNNTIHVKNQEMINAFLLFFVIHTIQVGVGIHGFQRVIYQDAKHDAWISVLLVGIATHIIAIIMIKTLEIYGSNDLYGIHQDIFGKWVGNFLNLLYILYCSTAFFSVLRNYIEVVQTWVFPNLSTWFISATLLLIVIYAFTGGLRVIVGISFFSFVLSIWLLPMLVYPLQFTSARSLLPIMETDIIGILKGAQSMTFTIAGFEILNVIYPFIKDKNKVQKHVHFGLLATTIIYLSVILVSITYFSPEQLNKSIWATLTLFSVVHFPFIERFEYIAVCFWMLVILPNLCLYLWAAYRGSLRLVKVNSNKFIWLFSVVIFMLSLSIETRTQINAVNTYFSKVGFYVIFVYPIFIYFLAIMKKKYRTRKEQKM
ncbi:spore germination protein (amino acid permease) [Paenisporosarcina sp. HGH0030]|uniref:GerAB/ArcD/ProY family transporter n=1 Tax=Paenisporosarcina sp. HGH0030 TaxID=1078085 RepID=UPI00034EAF55|nr:GerAB/ArcD/ProY family transporter [Paenisporosarcina sp. HGH0030]EPD50586.1 spore germination protein (amino acid permease) [Paenisporosarcina sp. HGH0030]